MLAMDLLIFLNARYVVFLLKFQADACQNLISNLKPNNHEYRLVETQRQVRHLGDQHLPEDELDPSPHGATQVLERLMRFLSDVAAA